MMVRTFGKNRRGKKLEEDAEVDAKWERTKKTKMCKEMVEKAHGRQNKPNL